VNMKEVTVAVGNEDRVRAAFEGADIVFSTTDFWAHFDKDREIAEGKLIIDQAKAAGVKLFVWSGLDSLGDLTDGRYPVPFFDSKGVITKYLEESGLPHIVVQSGFYFTNLMSFFAPKKQPDGTYILSTPAPPELELAMLDPSADYGLYVRTAIEHPDLGPGSEVLAGSLTSLRELTETLSKVFGKNVTYRQVGKDEFLEQVAEFGPAAGMLYNMYMAFAEVGFWGPKDAVGTHRRAGITPRTFEEIALSWDGPVLAA